MPSYGVTLLSGGLDSTTVAAYAWDRVDKMSAITFHYGQTHSKEVDCAVQIAGIIGIEHKLLDISFLTDVAWYSALTNPELFPVPTDRSGEEIGHGVPITYVPLRNTIFLSLSTAYLESQVLHAIEVEGIDAKDVAAYVYMAPNALDYSGYPDCRPEFYEKMRATLEYGSKLWTEYGVSINIETPIIDLSKAEIAELGVRLKAPLEHTWSCYKGGEVPCDSCDSCLLRAQRVRRGRDPRPSPCPPREGVTMLRVSRMPSGEPEIFRSVQGEGVSAGTPTVFLRLGMCNLACSWCDTKYTWDWDSYDLDEQVMSLEEPDVEQRISRFDLPHLVITGGEPMLQQKALGPLALSLKTRGFFCEVETNGTLVPLPEMVEAISQWNVSPKLANSGNLKGRREVPEALSAFREIDSAFFKFVIVEPSDFDEVSEIADRYDIPPARVVLMPEGTTAAAVNERGAWLAEACAERGFRFSTRLHILLWGDQRGR